MKKMILNKSSIKEAAIEMEYTRQHLGEILNGRTPMTVKFIKRFSAWAGIDPQSLSHLLL